MLEASIVFEFMLSGSIDRRRYLSEVRDSVEELIDLTLFGDTMVGFKSFFCRSFKVLFFIYSPVCHTCNMFYLLSSCAPSSASYSLPYVSCAPVPFLPDFLILAVFAVLPSLTGDALAKLLTLLKVLFVRLPTPRIYLTSLTNF